jgi:hypothetical protein
MPYDLLAPPQNNRGILDPTTAALLQAGFAGLAASGPQRRPVSLGQVAGQAGQAGLGAYQNVQQQQMAQEALAARAAETKRLHDAQIGNYNALAAERQAQADAKNREEEAGQKFRLTLDEMQQGSDGPLDPINILDAGISSGAFKPKDVTDFMGKVMERQASREQRIQELEMRLKDKNLAREQHESLLREMQTARSASQQDSIRLAAALRKRNTQYVNSAQGIYKDTDGVLTPALDPATGQPLKPQSSLTLNRSQITQAFKFRNEYNAMPEVKSVNDLEIRLKPVAEYGLSVAKGKAQQNPVKDQELLKLYLMVTHPKGDRISVMDYSELRKLPDLPARVYEAISAVFSGRTLSDRERADMLQTITNRYRGLTEARTAKRKDIEARAKAADVPVDLVFGD